MELCGYVFATIYMQQLLIDLPVSLHYISYEHLLALLDL